MKEEEEEIRRKKYYMDKYKETGDWKYLREFINLSEFYIRYGKKKIKDKDEI